MINSNWVSYTQCNKYQHNQCYYMGQQGVIMDWGSRMITNWDKIQDKNKNRQTLSKGTGKSIIWNDDDDEIKIGPQVMLT